MGRGRRTAGLWIAAGLAALASGASAAESRATAIVGATVFDATGAAPRPANVIIRDGRIVAVGPKARVPKGAKVIDARGKALLPGFFDVHTHWTPGGEPKVTPAIANAYIAAGVTTVNDFHQQPESFAPRRRWLGTLAAPHVNFVARMSTPGGHGADWADEATTKWLSSPQDARTEVKALVPYKPDFIKAFTDGWRYGVSADNTSMDQGTLSALVDEAHKNDIKVLTHTVTIERGRIAARAKVDIIAHSLQDQPIDAETVAMLKAAGTAYAPTLAVYDPDKTGRAQPDTPARRQSIAKFAFALTNVKALSDAGVNVVLGTDAGMPGTPHGVSTLREMELLVQAGLTPTQALMAGTSNAARALGEISDRGTIEAGKRADLVLVSGAPWTDIADVRKTDAVFVDGALVHGRGFKAPAANSQTAMPAIKVAALIDDFERADGRSSLDTLRLNDMDGGIDRTVQVAQVIQRAGGGGALSLAARMAAKDDPSAGVIIPLTRGSVEPVDARAFKGVRFELRGAGAYDFDINTTNGAWRTEVSAGDDWRTLEIPFSALKRAAGRGAGTGPWRGDDLLEVEFAGSRAPGQKLWLEIDNVTFY
ncbi:amidohydrolase family protein [Phenylobacterium sp.]|uniref:amidohydrolase family protein n=1 Tax=Phenylobacterium sp. TaxID=1871053 RepID=UPI00286A7A05|nr:amidohydrolase family protein [Phenylobacterium sp.]